MVRMIAATITNAWRAMQLLSHTTEKEEFTLQTYKKLLSNHNTNLHDFNYNLATNLIRSASNPYFHNVLFQTHHVPVTDNADYDQLGFERDLDCGV
jgi:predicted choloylglycine hydrolase